MFSVLRSQPRPKFPTSVPTPSPEPLQEGWGWWAPGPCSSCLPLLIPNHGCESSPVPAAGAQHMFVKLIHKSYCSLGIS